MCFFSIPQLQPQRLGALAQHCVHVRGGDALNGAAAKPKKPFITNLTTLEASRNRLVRSGPGRPC